MMKVRYANEADYEQILAIDKTITKSEFRRWTESSQVLFIYEKDSFAGWLQYSLFLEKYPFINRFYILDEYRGLGDGKLTLLIWQRQMEERFFDKVMASCEGSNVKAQKLYEGLGYKKIGTLALCENDDEIVYMKVLPKPDI
ncbi:MAG: GNAT family N-acetyltransferase [Eubacterium sp.]|nr:GNAT family N-acetyltransferase [Eubacterium sp.]